MNMVRSPQSSVQPVELELTLATVAGSILKERFDVSGHGHLPSHGENSSMLDYGKVSTRVKSKLPLWESMTVGLMRSLSVLLYTKPNILCLGPQALRYAPESTAYILKTDTSMS